MKRITKLEKAALVAVLLAFLLCALTAAMAEAHSSKAWRERLDARTTTLWIEGQSIGNGVVLNSRAELNVTWIERNLTHHLDKDRDVEEWLATNLSYYSSNRKETRAKIKGKDIFVLNYRAVKHWNFDPTKLVVDGYSITPDDILTKEEFWEGGDLPPGYVGTIAVCAPALKPGKTVEIGYDENRAAFEAPAK